MLNAKLILDLGNSQTRAVLRVGDLEDKTRQEYKFNLSNRFSTVFDSIPKSDEYTPDNTIVFSIDKPIKLGDIELEEGTYVNGLMSDVEFQALQIRPTALKPKYRSEVSLLSVFAAVFKSTLWIQKYFKENQNKEIELANLMKLVSWDLNILLPPAQVAKGEEEFKKSLERLFTVQYLMPNVLGDIQINNVNVLSEGVMAYMGVLIDKTTKQVRQNKTYMLKSNVLVVDIGAGTTDIILIRNGSPVENSKFTINQGGNAITSKMQGRAQSALELNLPNESYEEAAITGMIKRGRETHDIKKFLDISKREIAQIISGNIQSYLESANISIETVEYILVVGGGSMSQAKDVTAISKYILQSIRRYASKVDIVDLSDITSTEVSLSGSAEISPRELNVVGAGVSLDLQEIKEARQKKQEQGQA